MVSIKKYGNNPNWSVSNSSSTYSGNSSSFAQPTNLSLTVTAHGYPIWLMLVDEGTGSQSYVGGTSTTGNASCYVETSFFQDSTQLNYMTCGIEGATAANNPGFQTPPSSFQYVYTPSPGSYTYTFKIRANNVGSGDSYYVYRCKLVVFEYGY